MKVKFPRRIRIQHYSGVIGIVGGGQRNERMLKRLGRSGAGRRIGSQQCLHERHGGLRDLGR